MPASTRACAFLLAVQACMRGGLEQSASRSPKRFALDAQESHIAITNFNIGMRAYFEAGHCGPAHVVDVYNMTDALVFNRTFEETRAMTHDGFHWSMVRSPAETIPQLPNAPPAPRIRHIIYEKCAIRCSDTCSLGATGNC